MIEKENKRCSQPEITVLDGSQDCDVLTASNYIEWDWEGIGGGSYDFFD